MLALVFVSGTAHARYLNPNTGRFQTMDSYEGNSTEPASLHKYLYCQADPVNRIDPSGNTDFIQNIVTMGMQVGMQTVNAVRGAPAVIAAKTLPLIGMGSMYLTQLGPQAMQYLRSLGPQAATVIRTVALQSRHIVTRAQAMQSMNWPTHWEMRRALNYAIGNGANQLNIQWHHLVEQGHGVTRFGAQAIHSLANVLPTPTPIHHQITGFFGSKPDWLRTLGTGNYARVRDYVSTLSWQENYRIGLEIWKHAMNTGGRMNPQIQETIVRGP